MKRYAVLAAALCVVSSSALAAPNVTNATQKGSLLIFPDIRIDQQGLAVADRWNTLIRIQNDGGSDVDVKCYWMDGNKNRVDFIFQITRNQPVWFDARTGNGTYQVNRFPQSPANGFDNPFLAGPWPGGFVNPAVTNETNDTSGPYLKGMLACWAVDAGGQSQIKWNHLSGTATLYRFGGNQIAYEYSAYAFFVPTGLDLQPVGTAGALNLNGVEYDSCPSYVIGQFSPVGAHGNNAPLVTFNRLALNGCTLNLNQDWTPVFTKLQFDVWNEDEVKFTGAFECADSWHETDFAAVLGPYNGGPIDSGAQNFDAATLGTYSARYRVQGVKSAQCEGPGVVTQAVGLLAVQYAAFGNNAIIVRGGGGSTLAAAGRFNGRIVWDPAGSVPEGGIR